MLLYQSHYHYLYLICWICFVVYTLIEFLPIKYVSQWLQGEIYLPSYFLLINIYIFPHHLAFCNWNIFFSQDFFFNDSKFFSPGVHQHLVFFPHYLFQLIFFSCSTIHSSSILSFFMINKLCKTMHIAIISNIFFNGSLDRFIISFHLPLKYQMFFFIYIIVENCIKFQFATFSENATYPPLNR